MSDPEVMMISVIRVRRMLTARVLMATYQAIVMVTGCQVQDRGHAFVNALKIVEAGVMH